MSLQGADTLATENIPDLYLLVSTVSLMLSSLVVTHTLHSKSS